MTTAVDSSVLWTVFNDEPDAREWSTALLCASREGELVVCDVVLAEIAPAFASREQTLETLDQLGIRVDRLNADSAFEAGRIFRNYRREGGPCTHLIPDFLIGGHALCQSDQLAAVDRGYLRRYFPKLKLLTIHTGSDRGKK
jgi:predicted nucleic acid-binding protein